MPALLLLLALGLTECVCLYLTRPPGGLFTSAAHLAVLAAMVAMVAAPGQLLLVVVLVALVPLMSLAQRFRPVPVAPICQGQLAWCIVSSLVILGAMAIAPMSMHGVAAPAMAGTTPAMSAMAGMAGMPGMPAAPGWSAQLPGIAAVVVLAVFLLRAALQVRRWASTRNVPARPGLRHAAAVAGSLSMVVMCAAMVA